MAKDMSRPNWARTKPRLRRLAAQLRAQGFRVTEPADFDKPPGERLRSGGIVNGPVWVIGEHGPEDIKPIAGNDVAKL